MNLTNATTKKYHFKQVQAFLVTAFLLSNKDQEFHLCITRCWTLRWSDVAAWLRVRCPAMARCNRSLVCIRLKLFSSREQKLVILICFCTARNF